LSEDDDGQSVNMDPGTERQPLIDERSKSRGKSKEGMSAAQKAQKSSSKRHASKKKDGKRSKSKKKTDTNETKVDMRAPLKDNFLLGQPSSFLGSPADSKSKQKEFTITSPGASNAVSKQRHKAKPEETATAPVYEHESDSIEQVSLPVISRRQQVHHQVYVGGFENGDSSFLPSRSSKPSKTSGGNVQLNSDDQERVQGIIARHTKSLRSKGNKSSKKMDVINEESDAEVPVLAHEDRYRSSRSREPDRRSRYSQKSMMSKLRESAKKLHKETTRNKVKEQKREDVPKQQRQREQKPVADNKQSNAGRGGLRSFISSDS